MNKLHFWRFSMCLIVDSCVISKVFNVKNEGHNCYKPVFDWLLLGSGRLVVGGTTYSKELLRLKKYIPIIAELSKVNKKIPLDKKSVDKIENMIIKQKKHRDFDDAHLVAMVIESKCMVVCTDDTRANRHLKDRNLYPNGVDKPCLYTSERNKGLLSSKYLPRCHKERCVISKEHRAGIRNAINELAKK